ncbi:MAG: glycosyltransferase family 4 protein [Porticoccaceae bacterium]|nr:glycosyltransferase family 4 protein [Porticoccaceae bacterium]
MKKLLILQTHAIQYYAPIYCELTARGNIDVVVAYLTDSGAREYFDPGFNRMVKWDIDLLTGYRSQVMEPGKELSNTGFWGRNSRELLSILKSEKPDYILLYGYSSFMNWRAWWYAWRAGIKILYTSDSNARIDIFESMVKLAAKRVVVSTFFSKVSHFLYPSEANAEYLLKYGAAQDRMKWSPFAIDVARFSEAHSVTTKEYDFVWIGKFIECKRCEDYLRALENITSEGIEFRALLVGDGPCRDEIVKVAKNLIEQGSLDIRGFANQSEVPKLLTASDTLVFTCDNESYGLVATEAAASGCALVVADTIGCVGKNGSAQPGGNALIYSVGSIIELTNCLRKCLENRGLVTAMQSASMCIAAEHDIDKAAAIIESVINSQNIEDSEPADC